MLIFGWVDVCKLVSLLVNVVPKELDLSSICWFPCFCISQLHRVQKDGGSETTVVGVGGIMSIVAVGCEVAGGVFSV